MGFLSAMTTIQLDASATEVYRVALMDGVTINIICAPSGQTLSIEAVFTQGLTPKSVTFPSSVLMPKDDPALVGMSPFDMTHIKLISSDGVLWIAQRIATYSGWPSSQKPQISDDNATFNDEGTSKSGWTAAYGALTQFGSTLRFTKAGAGIGRATKAIAYPVYGKDFLLYGKIRAKCADGHSSVLWLNNGAHKVMSLWLGSATSNANVSPGAISIGGGYAGTDTVQQVSSNFNYEDSPLEFVLWQDTKYSTLSMYTRRSDGGWRFKGRIMCDYFQAANIEIVGGANSPDGNWIEFDYLTLCRPNVVAFGDSIQNGASFFSNDPALGLTNYESTWMYSAKLYPKLRNNFIVNKGVGGNTSPMMQARTAEVTGLRPRLVMIGASSNDADNGVSLETRTSCTQAMIQDFAAAGAQSIILNSVNGSSGFWGNVPINAHRDYCQNWWNNGRLQLNGAFGCIDTMLALSGTADRFSSPSLNVGDGLHPNMQGYANMGALYSA